MIFTEISSASKVKNFDLGGLICLKDIYMTVPYFLPGITENVQSKCKKSSQCLSNFNFQKQWSLSDIPLTRNHDPILS